MGLLSAIAGPILLAVQVTQAAIVGSVLDAETGRPLVGAVVALPDLSRATATDSVGRYRLLQAPAGPNHVTIRMVGYSHRSLHALVPREGELEINVRLSPDPIRLETVDVRAAIVIRGRDVGDTTSSYDREISMAAVANHPMLAEPEVFQALSGGEVAVAPESPSGVHIRGGASDQTAYLIDGIPVFNPHHTAGLSSAWNPDVLTRLRLSSWTPSPSYPHALSGTIEAVTRPPGDRHRALGSVSNTQARLTFDGPLGASGAGYALSARSGLHDAFAPREETSYLRSGTSDWMARLETPGGGGRLRFLGYGNDNETRSAATAVAAATPGAVTQPNAFEWYSRSLGAEWTRAFSGASLRVLGWSATGDANSTWKARTGRIDLAAGREDEGLLVGIEGRTSRMVNAAELRIEQSRTTYRIDSDSTGQTLFGLSARTPVATALVRSAIELRPSLSIDLGSSLALTGDDLHLAPNAQLRWDVSSRLAFTGSVARTHQFTQSLRNTESVVGTVFPVDLYIGAGAAGVPVARGDQGVIAADYRPLPGLRVAAQGYARASDQLLLVAPREGGPFTTGGFVIGSGTSRGASVDVSMTSARLAVVASYGVQRVRYDYGDSSYVPDHGTTHLLEGGLIVFPNATSSIRLGVSTALGRRTTTFPGVLEWESFNLLDRGSEFAGSPDYDGEALGGTPLPAYFRVDLGVRKHWHIDVGGREALVAVFGTVTNVLGRQNLLTYARNPDTGKLVGIEMRPAGPLVVGLDWRF